MKSGVKKIFSAFHKPKVGRDIILTGIPRSGTTLACKLLLELPNVIALNEPLDRNLFPSSDRAIHNIGEAFQGFRKSLLQKGIAPARAENGKITDNAYSSTNEGRSLKVQRSHVHFPKKLKKDFSLILKHCAEFTLIMPGLMERYACFACIRNPLAVLGSWRSVNVAVSRGKVSKSARLNPHFHEAYGKIEQLLDRQLFILDWYFGQYTDLPANHIIKYEDMVQNPSKKLFNKIVGTSIEMSPLPHKNLNPVYDKVDMQLIGEKLLKSEGAYWNFYDKKEVEKLLKQMAHGYK
jgi:hypothetical protein